MSPEVEKEVYNPKLAEKQMLKDLTIKIVEMYTIYKVARQKALNYAPSAPTPRVFERLGRFIFQLDDVISAEYRLTIDEH